MSLKEIKLRYAGKCADCGRDLPVGWNVFFDGESTPKKLYCKPCGQKQTDGEKPLDNAVVDQLKALLQQVGIEIPEPELPKTLDEIVLDHVLALHGRFDDINAKISGVIETLNAIAMNIAHLTETTLAKAEKTKATKE